jgi:hypothetical protein
MSISACFESPRIVRRIYPTQHPCPACNCTKHDVSVRSRPGGNGTTFIYRKCTGCENSYKVRILGMEVENSDGTTRLEFV